MTKYLNIPDDPRLNEITIRHKLLKDTVLERRGNLAKEVDDEPFELKKVLEDVKQDAREGSGLARSARFRKAATYLPEDSVKRRKSYFCIGEQAHFARTIPSNPMAMLQNPDMMAGMMKGNL